MGARRKSLGRKLAVAALLPLTVGVMLIAGTGAYRESRRDLTAREREAQSIATVFSATVADALVANDRTLALQSLRAIGAIDGIRNVAVSNAAGKKWLSIGNGVVLEPISAGRSASGLSAILAGQPVEIHAPIVKAGTPVGTLSLLVSTVEARDNLLRSVLQAIAIAALVAAAAQWLVLRLQAGVLRPMRQLAHAMKSVEDEHRFDLKVAGGSDDETGQLVDAFNAMLVNIRDRDERLADYRHSLERKVEERTRDLREAKDAAESATRAKSEFLATMSHEIRTPMNGMMVMSEILAGAELPARYRHYAELVVKSGKTLLAVINDILDFSKIEAGGLVLEATETDPRQVVTDVVQLFAEQARSKGLDLAARFDSTVPLLVTADPVRLSQVIGNLVNNALKFTEKGHVEVAAGFEFAHERSGVLRLSVADTGIGISQDGLSRIFESFVQADQSTTRRFGGTGLGLAICSKLVKAMGGEISATSTPGEGTRFDVRLPLEAVAKAAATPQLPLSAKALVVCQAALSRGVIVDALRDRGFAATAIASPAELPDEGEFELLVATGQAIETMAAKGIRWREAIALSELGDFTAQDLVETGRAGSVLMHPVTTSGCIGALDALLDPGAGEPGRPRAKASKSAPQRQFSKLRVLVADDSAVNREVVSLALSQMGIAPDIVTNGLTAVAKFRAGTYDIVLMDASMPEVDGFVATGMLREIEAETGRGRTPVIALTAHAKRQIADQIAAAGMDGHLLKPFTLSTLRATIEKYCGEAIASTSGDEPVGAARIAGEIIDRQTLRNLKEIAGKNASSILNKLYTVFSDSAPQSMRQLQQAIGRRDRVATVNAAHALKSMALNMAAARLSQQLAELEERARDGGDLVTDADAQTIAGELSAALAELARIMRSPDVGASGAPGTLEFSASQNLS